MSWTVDRVEKLEHLWSRGATFSEIARRLQVSVNAVKGKTDRMALKRGEDRRISALKAWHARRRIAKRLTVAHNAVLSKAAAQVFEPNYVPGPMARTLAHNTGCQFPVGDVTGADQLYCGEPTFGGRNYCTVCERRMRGQS